MKSLTSSAYTDEKRQQIPDLAFATFKGQSDNQLQHSRQKAKEKEFTEAKRKEENTLVFADESIVGPNAIM